MGFYQPQSTRFVPREVWEATKPHLWESIDQLHPVERVRVLRDLSKESAERAVKQEAANDQNGVPDRP